MKRMQSKNSSKTKSSTTFWEELITKYFDRQARSSEDHLQDDLSFDKENVYKKVIIGIRKRESKFHKPILKIAASVLLICSLVSAIYLSRNDINKWLKSVKVLEAKAAKGQVVMVKLEDGSRVWLNSDSKLIYPKHFEKEKREITLTGEAYFEVAHLAKKPFIIQSRNVKTVVLGTSFNIKAYPGNRDVEVTVLTGKVAVITNHGKKEVMNTVYLTPNQKISYASNDSQLQPYPVKAERSIGWKEGKLRFDGTRLAQALEEVERKYNVEIGCSDEIRNCGITADLNNEGLDKVLRILAKIINGSVSYENKRYFLNGDGCN